MPARASLHRVPQEAMGAEIPSPTKLKNASLKMALGICMAIFTMIGPIILGIRCLTIIRFVSAPVTMAAFYKFLLF